MAQVWQALSSLSGTMGRRGGITDAMLRGADATLGLKRAEYEIERGRKSDELAAAAGLRAERGLTLQEEQARRLAPVQQLEADKANEIITKKKTMIPVTTDLWSAGDPIAKLSMITPDKNGKATSDYFMQMFPGSTADDKGNILKKDGTPAMVSQYDWETKYKPAVMFTNIARTDPEKYLNGKAWEHEQALSGLTPGSWEYNERKKILDETKSTMTDKAKMAMLYGKQATMVHEGLIWAKANNADPQFLQMLAGEVVRTEARFNKYKGEIKTPEEKLKLEQLEENLKKTKAETKKLISESRKADAEAAGGGKPLTKYQRGQLTKDAWTIVNKEDENRTYSAEGPMGKEERQARFDEVIKTLMPPELTSPTAGLGDQGSAKIPTPPPGFELDVTPGAQPAPVQQARPPQAAGPGNRPVPAIRPNIAPPVIASPEQQIDNTAGLGFEAVPQASPSPELIPGMGGNIAAFKRSVGDATKVLVDFARAMGLQTKEQAAQQLASFAGIPVENVNSMPPNELAKLINAVITSQQAAAQQTMGNIQPYGIR